MNITEVSLLLVQNQSPALRAYGCALLDDALEIRNLRIVEPSPDRLIVCMPSRHRRRTCPACHRGVSVTALYCSMCSAALPPTPLTPGESRSALFEDLVVPIHRGARAAFEAAVLPCYRAEVRRAADAHYRLPWALYRRDARGEFALLEERNTREPVPVE